MGIRLWHEQVFHESKAELADERRPKHRKVIELLEWEVGLVKGRVDLSTTSHYCKDFESRRGTQMDRLLALSLLQECTGDEIWSLDYCQKRRVPEVWTEELLACFESGFRSHRQTIYTDRGMVNQYEGVRDVDLACKLGEWFGVDVERILAMSGSRTMIVRAIREAVEEG